MLKRVALLLGALVLVGIGVGGTLGAQQFAGGDSADCRSMNTAVHAFVHPKTPPPDVPAYFRTLNDVADVRDKVCG